MGAKNRAKAGHTYKQILSFYFPNTELRGEKMTIEQFIIKWCEERVGCPYIYGGTQKLCTTSYRKTQMNQYPSAASQIKSNCLILSGSGTSCKSCKWYDKTNSKARVSYDCAQFIRWGASAAGITGVKSGATSQWNQDIWLEKGQFSNVPSSKLCCVFRDSNGTKEHVGWYYNGYAWHAKGHAYGVVKTNNSQYKSWTHYAIMKGIYDSNGNPIEIKESTTETEVIKVLYQAKVESTEAKLNMRKSPSKEASRVLQIPPQGIVDVLEETNSEWWKVAYNNEVGYVMKEFLIKISSSTSDGYYVKIKCASASEAKRLVELLGQATAET